MRRSVGKRLTRSVPRSLPTLATGVGAPNDQEFLELLERYLTGNILIVGFGNPAALEISYEVAKMQGLMSVFVFFDCDY